MAKNRTTHQPLAGGFQPWWTLHHQDPAKEETERDLEIKMGWGRDRDWETGDIGEPTRNRG